jgi:hypothetical protein
MSDGNDEDNGGFGNTDVAATDMGSMSMDISASAPGTVDTSGAPNGGTPDVGSLDMSLGGSTADTDATGLAAVGNAGYGNVSTSVGLATEPMSFAGNVSSLGDLGRAAVGVLGLAGAGVGLATLGVTPGSAITATASALNVLSNTAIQESMARVGADVLEGMAVTGQLAGTDPTLGLYNTASSTAGFGALANADDGVVLAKLFTSS